MQIKTKAIVLHTLKYTDNSVIVHAYTEQHGRMAYVVNGVKSKKSVLRAALQQPLSILEIETNYNPKNEIQRIKESRLAYAFTSIPYNPSKNALSLFVAELLYRAIKEPHTDKNLYNFLSESIIILDTTESGVGNFHLVFMTQLSHFLGFKPHSETAAKDYYFDLQNGVFSPQQGFSEYLNVQDSKLFSSLLGLNFENMGQAKFSKEEKYSLLSALLSYYKLHLSNFSQIKSLEVMLQLFS